MNLRHNGWVGNIVKMIPGPSFKGASFVQKAITMGLVKTRYFLRISPMTGGKVMHGETYHTTLFEIEKDRGKSFTLGAVSRQLKATELFNIVAYGDDGVVWMYLQEEYAKKNISNKINEIKSLFK